MKLIFVISFVTAVAAALPAPAHACSFAGPTPHVVDPSLQATDHVPPTLPPISPPRITRGKGPEWSGCGQSRSTCDGSGVVVFPAQATDDVTEPLRIGYRVTLESGSLPSGFVLPGAIDPGADLVLIWDDGDTDDQEAIDFTLSVVAIDAAGNESAPQTVRVSNDPGGGCAIARPRPTGDALASLLLAALVLACRRRRTP